VPEWLSRRETPKHITVSQLELEIDEASQSQGFAVDWLTMKARKYQKQLAMMDASYFLVSALDWIVSQFYFRKRSPSCA